MPVTTVTADRPRRSRMRRIAAVVGTMGIAAALAVGVGPTAQAAVVCGQPAPIWVNSGLYDDELGVLREYSVAPDGALTPGVEFALETSYGDIAVSADGSTVFGVTFDAAPLRIDRIDTATGAVVGSVDLDFGGASGYAYPNALSLAPDGRLFIGFYTSSDVLVVDPATGVVDPAPVAVFPALPDTTPLISSGDFLTLSDGTLLGLATTIAQTESYAVRIDLATGTSTVVGELPLSFGAARSGDVLVIAGADGILRRIPALPTSASLDPIALVDLADSGITLWGAASAQDAGIVPCPVSPALPGTGSEAPIALLALGGGLLVLGAGAVVLRRREVG